MVHIRIKISHFCIKNLPFCFVCWWEMIKRNIFCCFLTSCDTTHRFRGLLDFEKKTYSPPVPEDKKIKSCNFHHGFLFQLLNRLNRWTLWTFEYFSTIYYKTLIYTGPFWRILTHMWQNAGANNVKRAIVCHVYFSFSKLL